MKRSKIFLGLTSGLLAIAGLVAAKSSRFHDIQYNFKLPNGQCIDASTYNGATTLNVGGVKQQLTTGQSNGYLIYTGFVSGQCTDPLYSGS
jgi:hypothetical protein